MAINGTNKSQLSKKSLVLIGYSPNHAAFQTCCHYPIVSDSNPAVRTRNKKRPTFFTNPAFQCSLHSDPVAHTDLFSKQYISITKSGGFFKRFFCQFK